MGSQKIVEVKITDFTQEMNAPALLTYAKNCFDKGSANVLYVVPNISLIDYYLIPYLESIAVIFKSPGSMGGCCFTAFIKGVYSI